MNKETCPYCPSPCPIGFGKCHCGCNKATVPGRSRYYRGQYLPAGTPAKYVRYHHTTSNTERTHDQRALRRFHQQNICPYCGPQCTVEPGDCHCGCGESAGTYDATHRGFGHIQGYPRKFLNGHNARLRNPLTPQQIAYLRKRYAEEDVTQQQLADEYGVSRGHVGRILRFELHAEASIEP